MVRIIVNPLTAAVAVLTAILSLSLFIALPLFFTAAVFVQERADAALADPA